MPPDERCQRSDRTIAKEKSANVVALHFAMVCNRTATQWHTIRATRVTKPATPEPAAPEPAAPEPAAPKPAARKPGKCNNFGRTVLASAIAKPITHIPTKLPTTYNQAKKWSSETIHAYLVQEGFLQIPKGKVPRLTMLNAFLNINMQPSVKEFEMQVAYTLGKLQEVLKEVQASEGAVDLSQPIRMCTNFSAPSHGFSGNCKENLVIDKVAVQSSNHYDSEHIAAETCMWSGACL